MSKPSKGEKEEMGEGKEEAGEMMQGKMPPPMQKKHAAEHEKGGKATKMPWSEHCKK